MYSLLNHLIDCVKVVHLKRFSFVVDGWEKNDALIHFDCLPLDVSSVVHPLIREKASPRSECFNLYAVTVIFLFHS